MPANSKKTNLTSKSSEFVSDSYDSAAVSEETPTVSKQRKRLASTNVTEKDTEAEERISEGRRCSDACDDEMQTVLSKFGADVTRTFAAKRRKLQSFAQTSLKSTDRKYDDIFKSQQNERKKLSEEFSKQITAVINQWENDLSSVKDNEEKLEVFLRQHQKFQQQQRVVQSQRVKSIKQLHEQYIKSQLDLESAHQDQQTNIQGELRKELALLQKKMLKDTQQEEISNVRKSLQTMLAQV